MERIYKYEEATLNPDTRIIHHIKMSDEVKGGWYQQISAMEGLIRRSLNRWYDFWYLKHHEECPNSKVRFDHHSELNDRLLVGFRDNAGYGEQTFTHIHHESVWAFMDSIGYNHKDKRVSNIDKHLILNINTHL